MEKKNVEEVILSWDLPGMCHAVVRNKEITYVRMYDPSEGGQNQFQADNEEYARKIHGYLGELIDEVDAMNAEPDPEGADQVVTHTTLSLDAINKIKSHAFNAMLAHAEPGMVAMSTSDRAGRYKEWESEHADMIAEMITAFEVVTL